MLWYIFHHQFIRRNLRILYLYVYELIKCIMASESNIFCFYLLPAFWAPILPVNIINLPLVAELWTIFTDISTQTTKIYVSLAGSLEWNISYHKFSRVINVFVNEQEFIQWNINKNAKSIQRWRSERRRLYWKWTRCERRKIKMLKCSTASNPKGNMPRIDGKKRLAKLMRAEEILWDPKHKEYRKEQRSLESNFRSNAWQKWSVFWDIIERKRRTVPMNMLLLTMISRTDFHFLCGRFDLTHNAILEVFFVTYHQILSPQ